MVADCGRFRCSLDCEDNCGWNRDANACLSGSKTSDRERELRLGDCGPATTLGGLLTPTSATTAATRPPGTDASGGGDGGDGGNGGGSDGATIAAVVVIAALVVLGGAAAVAVHCHGKSDAGAEVRDHAHGKFISLPERPMPSSDMHTVVWMHSSTRRLILVALPLPNSNFR